MVGGREDVCSPCQVVGQEEGHQEEGDGSQHRQETQEKGEVALISIPSHLPEWLDIDLSL